MALDPEELERIKALRDPSITKQSQWGRMPDGPKKPRNPNTKASYTEKSLFGKEQRFEGGQAKRHSKDHKW